MEDSLLDQHKIKKLRYSCSYFPFPPFKKVEGMMPINWCRHKFGPGWIIQIYAHQSSSHEHLPSDLDRWRYRGAGDWEFANQEDFTLFKLIWL